MKKAYLRFVSIVNCGQSFALLFLRLALAYTFWDTGKRKFEDISSIAEWFGSLEIPVPMLSAYMATYTELIGAVLLALGLGTRLISIPLIITMLVAIKTVHWENGFASGDNGYEIPLYFILMLFVLFTFGAGRLSLDYVIGKRINH